MKMIKKILLSLAISSATSLSVYAANPCNAHTWHTVFARNGQWTAQLSVISEGKHGWFVDNSCSKIDSFTANVNSTPSYGFLFDNQADFDLAYTLTLTSNSNKSSKAVSFMQSKACVFVVTADGPAQPNIKPISYNGAQCYWEVVEGIGENFYAA